MALVKFVSGTYAQYLEALGSGALDDSTIYFCDGRIFKGQSVQGVGVQSVDSKPATPLPNTIYVISSTDTIEFYDGTSYTLLSDSGSFTSHISQVATTSLLGHVKSSTANNNVSVGSGGTMTINTVTATKGGTGQTSYTVGDVLYASSTTALSKLGIGTAGQVLKAVSGKPAWSDEYSYTHPTSGVTAGTYTKVTVDAKGHVTAGASATKSDVGLSKVDNLSRAEILADAALTGTPTAPTAESSTNSTQVATTAFVQSVVNSKVSAADAMRYKGVLAATSDGIYTPTATKGDTYKVSAAGKINGISVEVGDMLICLADTSAATASTVSTINANWNFIQANIDGAVIGPSSATNGNLAIFDGTTGKLIKNSSITSSSVSTAISNSHTHSNKTQLDTYNKTQSELLSTAQGYVDTHAEIAGSTSVAGHLKLGTTATTAAAGNHTHSSYVNQNAFAKISDGTNTATADAVQDTLKVSAGTAISVAVSDASNADTLTISHADVTTAGTASGSASKTLTWGDTFTIPTVTYNAQGHVTGKGTTTMTMPTIPSVGNGTITIKQAGTVIGSFTTNQSDDATLEFTNTDTKVTSTTINPASATSYYPTLVKEASNSEVFINDGLKYAILQGTASANGFGKLRLGNATANGTVGNKYGQIDIYSTSTGYGYITQASTGSNLNHILPATAGTILNTGTTSFTQTLTSGTKIGSIKINGTSKDIYIPVSLKNPTALTVKGNGTTSFTYDGSAAKALNIKAGSNVNVLSDTSGNITINATDTTYDSLKNPYALTLQFNGTTNKTYDGSSAQTLNITPSAIGAATSSHTHSYLPLSGGTVTGNINAGDKDATAAKGFYVIDAAGVGRTGVTYNPSTGQYLIAAGGCTDADGNAIHTTVQIGTGVTSSVTIRGKLKADNFITGTKTVILSSATVFATVTLTSTDLGFTPTANTSILVSVRKSSTPAPLYLNVYTLRHSSEIYLCISNGAGSNTNVPTGTYYIDYIVTNNA